jgi:hypothetical protein
MIVANVPPPSTLPPRSNFIRVGAEGGMPAGSTAAAASQLDHYVTSIARIAALLRLNGPPGEQLFPYRLALRRKDSDEIVPGGRVHKGAFDLALVASGDVAQAARRRVYVLALQSDGAIHLLYPVSNVENEFPPRGAAPERQYVLRGPTIDVGEPYGTDTLVLIASQDSIPGLDLLEQTEVLAIRGPGERARGAESSALADLFVDQASRTRGIGTAPTANWSIQQVEFDTAP